MCANYHHEGRGWGPPGPRRGGFGRGSFRGRGDWNIPNNYRGGRGGRGCRGRPNSTGQRWPKAAKAEQRPGKRLSEEEISVTEYVSDHEGFLGIIKSRFSDFQVSEINERGEVAQLTDLRPPEPPAEAEIEEDEDLLFEKYNLEILPTKTWNQINKLISETSDECVEIDATAMSKEERTKIHDAVKRAFGDIIVGSTVARDEKKFITFQRYREGVRIDKRVKWMWGGEYVHFIVYKENIDTMEAAQRLADRLHLNIKPSMLGYAGTKDRRAKTSQWFSLRKVDPRKVAAAVQGMREMRAGNYSFSATHLKLGMLKGNKFRIALRNVTADDLVVDEACWRLQQRGFINYYGLQRFGTRVEMPTYKIGLMLLRRNFKEAIEGILLPRSGPLQEALRVFASQGAAKALRVWPRRSAGGGTIEWRVVKALATKPNDLVGAINKLARNTRLLYLHSYQSLVWNRAASARLKLYGLRPAVGDLVAQGDIVEEMIPESIEETDSQEIDVDNIVADDENQDGVEDKMADASTEDLPQTSLESSTKQNKQKLPVKVLTEKDVESNRYTIFDIVLPLPGYMVEYPPNMKDLYVDILAKDEVSMDLDKKFRSFSMSGAYRHLVVRPAAVEWNCVRYSDPYADLIASDADLLEGRKLNGIVEDGKYKALLLTMSLPASCYATMALRELLKVDTSCDNQALQNNYHKQKPVEHPQTGQSDTKSEIGGVKCDAKMDCQKGEKRTADVGESGENRGVKCDVKAVARDVKMEFQTGEKGTVDAAEGGENSGVKCDVKAVTRDVKMEFQTGEKGTVDAAEGGENSGVKCEVKPVASGMDCQTGEKRKADGVSVSDDDLEVKRIKQEIE